MTAGEMRQQMITEIPLMDDGRLVDEYNSMFGTEERVKLDEIDTSNVTDN